MAKDEIEPVGAYNAHDLESTYTKGEVEERQALDPRDLVTENEERDLKRGLSQRHISMIALAG
jgi:amino acid transporter